MSLEHCREDDAVEDDIVLADEMDHAGVVVLPPLLPCAILLRVGIAKLLGVGDIADRSIEPHIEHLAFSTFDRHRYAPVEVASHSTRLQAAIEPALALAIDIRTPLLVVVEDPLAKPLLMLVKREIPVLGALLDERVAVDGIVWVDELIGRECCATLLTLVAISTECMAAGTFATDVAVGEELVGLFVVELFGSLLNELAFIIELAEEVAGKLVVNLACCAAVDVERDAELLERVLDEIVVAIDHILNGNAFLAGADSHWNTMFVGSANEENLLLLEAKIAHIDICWHIYTCQVSDMYRTIGIGQC